MSYDMIREDVPPFQPRVGDYVLQGSNNSLFVLGRDRAKAGGPATVDDGRGDQKGAGAAHLVVGRGDKDGNPDIGKDSAYLYLSMKTRLDENLNVKASGVPADNDVPAAVLKSDNIRVVARKNVMVVTEDSSDFVFLDGKRALVSVGNGSATIEVTKDRTTMSVGGGASVTIEKGKITVDGDSIELGKGATERIIKGDAFKRMFVNHTHPTGTGPTGGVIEPWIDEQLLSQRKATVS